MIPLRLLPDSLPLEASFLTEAVVSGACRGGTLRAHAHTYTSGTMSRPPTISLEDPTPKNIAQLKRINSVVFPVMYNDEFYNRLLASTPSGLVKLGTSRWALGRRGHVHMGLMALAPRVLGSVLQRHCGGRGGQSLRGGRA